MTKEPIMIDDVDVAECEYAEPSYTTPKCAINDWIHCDGHDCHYKQLKRLENEYEGFAVKYTDMEIALKTKEEECEKKDKDIKFLLEKLDLANNRIQDCEIYWEKEKKNLKQQLDQLKVENEELQEKIKAYDEVYSNHDVLNERNNYKQALQEIKNLTENACCKDLESCKICVLRNSCTNQKILQFLQKCEVIDG